MTDIVSNATTTAVFDGNPNQMATFSGELETYGDKDWIKVTLTAGTTYKFFGSASAADSSFGDSDMRLLDTNGVQRAANDNESGLTDNSFFSFTATATGAYFIEISNEDQFAGEYSIAVIANESHQRLDRDPNSFSGAGNALIVGDKGADIINLDGATPEDALGEQGDDVIVGDNNANFISGGLGNDWIDGTGGADLLFGDAGEDRIEGGDGNDNIRGGDGADYLAGHSGADALFFDQNTIHGGAGSDFLYGSGGGDVLIGGSGQDRIVGRAGNDQAYVDDAGDYVEEDVGGGNDTVFATASFALAAGQEIETLRAQNAASTAALKLTGNAFANTLIGNNGANVLRGAGGIDVLRGLLGKDTYALENGSDTVIDTGGIDTITSTISRSLVGYAAVENLVLLNTATALNSTGNNLNNTITGNNRNNVLSGGAGKDLLKGGLGADTLNGFTGKDTLTGGLGNDKFVFNNAPIAANADKITDFRNVAGNNDVIHLDNAVFNKLGAPGALNANLFFAGAAAHDADDRIVYNKATGALLYDTNGSAAGGMFQIATLVNKPTLTASDFVVV